jgi:hypothetical protein
MPRHDLYTGDNIHVAHAFTYADAAGRTAATGFAATDRYKLALQLNDASFWVLTDDDPATWVQVGVSGGGGALPVGGADGQVLTKQSASDGDADWETPVGGGGALPVGGADGQVLTKQSASDGDADWETPVGGGGVLTLLTSDTAPTGGKQYLTLTVPSSAPGDLIIIGTFVSEKATAGNDTLLLDNGSGTALLAASGLTTGTLGGVPSASALTLSSPAALEMTIFNAEPVVAFPAVINTFAAKFTLNGIGQGAAWISNDFKGHIAGPIATLRFKTGGGSEWAVGSTVSMYRRG